VKAFFTGNRILLMASTVILVAAAVIINVTEVCRLRAVTVDGKPMPDWQGKFGLSGSRLLTDQPIDLVAMELLGTDDIVKVEVDFALPGTIRIRTNDYSPAAFLVDRTIGEIWGLDLSGRIVPLDKDLATWELPFFTGLVAGRAYGGCDDLRVGVVLKQLAALRKSDPDAYSAIGELNFSPLDHILVRLEGLDIPVKVQPDGLARQMAAVVNFVRTIQPDLSDAKALDPRFGNLVVKECEPDTTMHDDDSTGHLTVEAYD
jgi:hypothetical protein